jgi:heptosyltransferase-1
MRVLIIKTSSMGDIIHTLPALTDATHALPSITFDWIVEENFAEIPRWHARVNKVIPIALRRWRKKIFSKQTLNEWKKFLTQLRMEEYDLVIDAQGLLKSAFIMRFSKGIRCGLDKHSAREWFAALLYQRSYSVDKKQHAVTRIRHLFSQALGYPLPTTTPSYGVDRKRFYDEKNTENYLVFLHGTTWETKHWPEEYWIQLAHLVNKEGLLIKLPWGNTQERERAARIAAACPNVQVLPKLDLAGMANVLAGAKSIVAVDTGLGHLAAALDVPTVSLYGPTNPILTGAIGKSQAHLSSKLPCSPCMSRTCALQQNLSPLNPPCFAGILPSDIWSLLNINKNN